MIWNRNCRSLNVLGCVTVVVALGVLAESIAAEPQVREAEQKRVEVIERIAPTVVAVFAKGGADRKSVV